MWFSYLFSLSVRLSYSKPAGEFPTSLLPRVLSFYPWKSHQSSPAWPFTIQLFINPFTVTHLHTVETHILQRSTSRATASRSVPFHIAAARVLKDSGYLHSSTVWFPSRTLSSNQPDNYFVSPCFNFH